MLEHIIHYNSLLSLDIPVSFEAKNSETPAFDEITDFIVAFKANEDDELSNAIFSKSLLDGGLSVKPETEGEGYYLHFSETDYGPGKMEANNSYFIYMGFKTASIPVFQKVTVFIDKIKVLPNS